MSRRANRLCGGAALLFAGIGIGGIVAQALPLTGLVWSVPAVVLGFLAVSDG